MQVVSTAAVLLAAVAVTSAQHNLGENTMQKVAEKILKNDDNKHVEVGQFGKKKKLPVCSRTCEAKQCTNALGLRWGKYCGVGHSGCEGEEPCDAYDSCCMAHDECVGRKGMLNSHCHTDLKNCLRVARTADEKPHCEECSVKDICDTMSAGMDLANLFSGAMSGGLNMDQMEGAVNFQEQAKLKNKPRRGADGRIIHDKRNARERRLKGEARRQGKRAEKVYRRSGDEL